MTAPNEATARWIIDRCNSLLGSMTSMPNGLSDPVLNIKIGRLFEALREVREHFCSKLEEYNVQ
jgi:hypothetical protein